MFVLADLARQLEVSRLTHMERDASSLTSRLPRKWAVCCWYIEILAPGQVRLLARLWLDVIRRFTGHLDPS